MRATQTEPHPPWCDHDTEVRPRRGPGSWTVHRSAGTDVDAGEASVRVRLESGFEDSPAIVDLTLTAPVPDGHREANWSLTTDEARHVAAALVAAADEADRTTARHDIPSSPPFAPELVADQPPHEEPW